MGFFRFIGELIVTDVTVANPDNTLLIVDKNGHTRWSAPEHVGDIDSGSHEYLGRTANGFHTIGEKENTITKKGIVEGILSLF